MGKGKKVRTIVRHGSCAPENAVRAECGFVCDTRDVELITGVRADDACDVRSVAVALVQGIRVGVRGIGAFALK